MFTGNKDVDIEILNKIKDEDLADICNTNKYLHDLCQSEDFWNARFRKIFLPYLLDLDILKYKGDASWKEYYNWLSSSLTDSYPYFISANASELDREDVLILLEKVRHIKNVSSVYIHNQYETGKYYTRDGKINGIKEGLYMTYYPNGNKKSKKEYKNGLPLGPHG